MDSLERGPRVKERTKKRVEPDGTSAVKRIHDTLRGPVIDIFLANVPAFQGLGRDKAFELIISNHALAEECFKLFRRRPDLFADLLVGPNGQPITDETHPLHCGRNLNQVVALVVRSIAKRHFLARFPPDRRPPPLTATESATLWRRIQRLIKKAPPPTDKRPRRKATRGDRLYRAFGNHLLYEWQLPLLPHYTPLPVSLVRQLGARILDYREPQQLKTLLLEGAPLEMVAEPIAESSGVSANAPLSEPPASTSETNQASQATPQKAQPANERAESMWRIAQSLELAKVFSIDERELRRTVAHASAAGGIVIASLGAAGIRPKESVAVLCALTRSLGYAGMTQYFGRDADPKLVARFADLLREGGVAAMVNARNIHEQIDRIVDALRQSGELGTAS